jgi:hypothetical protein
VGEEGEDGRFGDVGKEGDEERNEDIRKEGRGGVLWGWRRKGKKSNMRI